jgi:hypothetical protein
MPQKFGKPTQMSDLLTQKKSTISDDTIDSMITQPNAKTNEAQQTWTEYPNSD